MKGLRTYAYIITSATSQTGFQWCLAHTLRKAINCIKRDENLAYAHKISEGLYQVGPASFLGIKEATQ